MDTVNCTAETSQPSQSHSNELESHEEDSEDEEEVWYEGQYARLYTVMM